MSRLSTREKREFYSNLARLIRSGTALPAAIELLARDTPWRMRQFLRALNERVRLGEPLGDALLLQRSRVTDLEISIITAAGKSGRMDKACDQLARYFDALGRAQGQMISRIIYPLLMFHMTVLFLNVSILINGGLAAYLWKIAAPLGVFYLLIIGGWLACRSAVQAARTNVGVDMALRRVPGVGNIREKFALARFFTTMDAQLEAQVNIWDSFANAARTSNSARIIAAARDAMPMLKNGERLSEAMAAKRVVPDEHVRALRVAEQTGEVDAELTRLAQESEDQALTSLERWSEWMPRIFYILILMYAGWQIVATYMGVLNGMKQYMNFGQ
ncbi:MAG TPA: type II secretion system F family protein [Chthoniobacteraceae bacterium]|nr:type II secretion system F family protein [Chthoniobacteraceae bacterium]